MFGSVAPAHLNQHSWDGNLLADKPRDFLSAEAGRHGSSRNRGIAGAWSWPRLWMGRIGGRAQSGPDHSTGLKGKKPNGRALANGGLAQPGLASAA
jgi:hypothetical protein